MMIEMICARDKKKNVVPNETKMINKLKHIFWVASDYGYKIHMM